ncbi:MAG: carboxypeptidase-like regulatory domain-containing protein [Muribaculaceae bacterium]|nr:carboxypeptidase-like regulatory domain-containing protein [Muribaculaceae bacterium]
MKGFLTYILCSTAMLMAVAESPRAFLKTEYESMVCLFLAVSVVAQVNVSGSVVDKESNEPFTGASVFVKGADGKIKK